MTNAIELHGLTKEYPGFRLGSLDLTLPSGSIMGLVGGKRRGKKHHHQADHERCPQGQRRRIGAGGG